VLPACHSGPEEGGVKKLLIAIIAIVVVLVVALLVAPFLIPTDAYKAKLIALVKADTGRDLTIGGPVKFSFLPSVELEASDVAFANAPGAQDKDMLQLKKLEIEVKVLPLLHGAVELSQFVLTEPQISLEIDKTGRPNWQFAATAAGSPAGAAPAAPAATPQSASRAPPLSQLSLGDVRLVNGRISYRDDRTGKAEVIDAIDMKLSLPNLESPLAAEGSAQYNGQKLSLAVGVDKPDALLSGGDSGFHIRLDGAPLTVGFTGDMTGLPPKKLGGTVDLTVPSVRGLATWAGSPLPPGPGLQKLAIKGRVDASGTTYQFSNADITFDAITGQGAITVDTGGAVPSLKGSLSVDKLDVNPYLPPETASASPAPASSSGGGGGGTPSQASAGWSDTPIDLSPLKLANLDFDVKAGSILYRKIVVGPSALALHLQGGKFEADLSQLSLYGGKGQGKVSVDGAAATPAIAMNFALSGVQVEPLAQAAANTDRISGTGNINFDVAGTGKSQRALVSALNGKGAFALANGEIKGVNLIALATNAAKTVTGGSGGANETSFGSLTGTFTITNGILKNNDLALKSGIVPMTGAGTVDLPNRHVDYRITPRVAGALQIPIIVSGPWDNLSYRPDFAGALQGTAKGLINTPGAILNAVPGVNQVPGVNDLPGGSGGANSGSNPLNQLKSLFGH
jgi:AsmA protein